MLLVILIALWAMVLLPPYLKDRRATSRTFRSGGSSIPSSSSSSAQRFLPLQQASAGYPGGLPSAVTSPRGISGVTSLGNRPSNVIDLRQPNQTPAQRAPLATSAADYLAEAPTAEAPTAEERTMHEAWDTPGASAKVGMPTSTAAARERRRQIILGLSALAFATLLLAYFAGGAWIAAHVAVDIVMLGYVILLVRHRQLAADRMLKVEPIRPPVTEQAPVTLQAAPSYLVRSNTGS